MSSPRSSEGPAEEGTPIIEVQHDPSLLPQHTELPSFATSLGPSWFPTCPAPTLACTTKSTSPRLQTLRPMSMSETVVLSSSTANLSKPLSKSRIAVTTMLAFAALTLSIFLVALDTVLLPTALPSISRDFHIPDSLYAWTGSAYLLANASSIPLWGKLSDVFGRKPIILASNTIFLVGSVVCAVSVNASMLVAGRAVQGLGGGGVNVLVYVCVADLFAIRDRSFYMGIVGTAYAVACSLGPVLGGVFSQALSWRWCFYINLPLVSIAIFTLYFTIDLHLPRTPFLAGMKSLDWLGTMTILTATIFLLVGLQLGGDRSFSTATVICLLIFGSLTYVIFPLTQWWEELIGGSPIMPLRIFRDISNLSALGVCACDALLFNAVAYFLPLYFQLVLAIPPFMSGVFMLALAVPLALVSFLGGWVMEKTGRFLEILQTGLAILTLGVGLLISFNTDRDLGKIIGFLILVGTGFGPNFHAPLIALQTRITEADMAAGTSAFGFVRMVSGAIGVVVGQVVFQLMMHPHLSKFVKVGLDLDFASALAGGDAISEASKVASLPMQQRAVVRKGMTQALRGTWVFFTIVSGVGLLISFGIKRTMLEREITKDNSVSSAEEPKESNMTI